MADMINDSLSNGIVIDMHEAEKQGWHGKTTIRKPGELTLDDNHLVNRWDIKSIPLYVQNGKKFIPAIAESDGENTYPWSILGTTDDSGLVIGKPFNPGSFVPISNKEFIGIIKSSVKGIGFKVSSVLSCCNRGRIAVTLALDEMPEYKAGGHSFEPYLTLLNGHDQSCQIKALTSNIDVVCNNTFNMALNKQGGMVNCSIKHTKNVRAEIANLPEIIQASLSAQSLFAQTFEQLTAVPVRHSEAKAILTGALLAKDFSPEDVLKSDFTLPTRLNKKGVAIQDVSTRALNTVDRMLELFHDDSKGNQGQSLADVFSAVTDYYTHESSGGDDTWKQYVSSEFGNAATAKQEFLALLGKPSEFELVKSAGEKLVSMIN